MSPPDPVTPQFRTSRVIALLAVEEAARQAYVEASRALLRELGAIGCQSAVSGETDVSIAGKVTDG